MQKRYRKCKFKSDKTKNGKAMLLSRCATCHNEKSRFIKEKEAIGLLSSLGLQIPLSKIPLLVDNLL